MNTRSNRSLRTIVVTLLVGGIMALALGGYLAPLSRGLVTPLVGVQVWVSARYTAIRDYLTAPRDLAEGERRRVVGVVPPAVQLFGGSVWENLTLRDASAPPESVAQAARIAGIVRFVSALPDGYHTRLSGEGGGPGVQLSEGQQQLLSLARALVWDPALLLLDEATAAVDNVSEAEFRAALGAVLRGDDGRQRAVITVAHRLSTAREADQVVVLDGGRVVEQGAPEMLIRQGGRFAALVELEAAGWDWQSRL